MNPIKAIFDRFSQKKAQQDAEKLAVSIADRSVIKNPNSDVFRNSGVRAATIIGDTLQEFGIPLDAGSSVLDFGAGSGRVALPLLEAHKGLKLTAMDVDAEAIEYLSLQLPKHCSALVSSYEPPLQIRKDSFDAVYAISVWSHFPEDLGLRWLQEMQRITRPGAILLISVGARTTLETSKKRPWTDISIEEYEREKFVYREYRNLHDNEKHYPGIAGEGSWGVTAIHPDYIREKWGEIFDVLDVREGGTPGSQDLVVLKRR